MKCETKDSFQVGDRISRIPEERYEGFPNNFWTATIVKKAVKLNPNTKDTPYDILTDSGQESTWSDEFFRRLTKLERALK